MRRSLLLAVLVALVAAGCSGGSSDGSTSDATTTTAAATTTGGAGAADAGEPAEVAADPSAGCGTEPDVDPIGANRPGDVEQTFASGGVDRIYRLAVPDDYSPDEPAPLVLNLHGSGSNAIQASVYGDVPRAATDRGMIVVTPQAIDAKWQLGPDGADADFLRTLVDDIESRYCIDQNRVHIMGISLGAWKAAATGCAEPDRYASAALVAVEVFPGTCDVLPVVAFHGTADNVVPYGEGADPGVEVSGSNARLPGAIHNIDAWAKNDGCEAEPKVLEIGDDVVLRRWSDCDDEADVELYTVQGGGHTWPGADIDIAGNKALTTQTIDATDIALDWFEAHPRRPER